MLTTDKNDPKLIEGQKNETGQHEIYLVLSEEERAQGFIRPVRDTYRHVGKKIESEGEIVSLEEHPNSYYTKDNGYVAFIQYPESRSPLVGRYIKEDEYQALKNKESHIRGCNGVTSMGRALAETYARDPKFYGATFCVVCNKHLPVEEFVWEGTNITVGE